MEHNTHTRTLIELRVDGDDRGKYVAKTLGVFRG